MSEISWLALKAGVMVVWFVVAYLIAFYFIRKKIRNVPLASFLPAVVAFLVVVPFYGGRLRNWIDEAERLWRNVLSPELLPLSLGICLGLGMVAVGALLSRKARLGAWGWEAGIDPYRFRAAGQLMAMLVLLYFVEATTLELSFLFLMALMAAFITSEFFKSFYAPDLAEPTRPASRLRRISYWWTGTAGPGERFYLPSLFCLIGLLIVFLWSPNYLRAPLLLLALSDPIATWVGTKFGKRKLPWGKSLEGSACFFIVALLCLLLPCHYGLALSVVTAALVALVESFCKKGVDNLTIPLATSLLLRFLPL
jgi:dolichol kinase